MKVVPCVLFASLIVGCSHITINSVRTTYSDAQGKLDVSCATFPASDGADVNSKLKGLYDQGWKLATTGSNGADLFLCFERPISMADAPAPRPRPRAKPAAAPPPPAATDDSSASSDDQPKARARHRPALDGDDSSATPAAASDDSDSDAPPPKSKRHRPTSSDDN